MKGPVLVPLVVVGTAAAPAAQICRNGNNIHPGRQILAVSAGKSSPNFIPAKVSKPSGRRGEAFYTEFHYVMMGFNSSPTKLLCGRSESSFFFLCFYGEKFVYIFCINKGNKLTIKELNNIEMLCHIFS